VHGFVATRILKHRGSTIWQRRFWEQQIGDENDFARLVDYIQFNLVKQGHVQRAVDWPHSTFHRYVRDGVYTHDWAVTIGSAVLRYD
jgi:putative transposase